ncbi:YifB family Mg chelatase-like AAA ATPase [Robertmurraya massiliosenegalensis]|uniref:YifB family Mg chelatase-like AAA ATPase n=1 Tax=Robertmurraya TaxID=2837507 RepID=UPI0039A69011
MTVKVLSVGLKGLKGYCVQVEVQATLGVGAMVIVGLPDASVKEAKERVLSSIRSLGHFMADKKIVVNMSPSEQRKNGPLFDLALAVGVLKEIGGIKEKIPLNACFLGALSLDGSIEKVEGMLPALLAAKQLGIKKAYIPYDPLIPLDMLEEIECKVVHHIKNVIDDLNGEKRIQPHVSKEKREEESFHEFHRDFIHIVGHEKSKQSLEIAAAGRHNVLMVGPPGCGKSFLAESFPSILPPLNKAEQLEVMSLYQLAREKLISPHIAPFRNPHHSASSISIIGGGSYPKPGEISLAHHGVLFLDEMAEFTKKTLDMLRQPLDSAQVTISRVHSTVTYPASFTLIATMNPCPCGYLGSTTHYCTCNEKQIIAYRNRISGPIFDRIDILLSLKPVNLLSEQESRETSSQIRLRVEKAQEKQFNRYQQPLYNANVPFEILCETSPLTEKQLRDINQISLEQHWSNRVQVKVIRIARTIADLRGEDLISDESIWKAIELKRDGISMF